MKDKFIIKDYVGRKVKIKSYGNTSGSVGVIDDFSFDKGKWEIDFGCGTIGYYHFEEFCFITDFEILDSNDSYNEGHDIEFLDRINTVQLMLNELLINHKAAKRYGVSARLDQVDSLLAEIYQEVGSKVL